MLPLRVLQHLLGWHTNHINDKLKLFLLVRAWKQWESCVQLDHNATETPHIYLLSVWEETEDDVWRPVESTLNISVYDFIFEAAATEIGNDDATLVLSFQENVFWLEVTMDDT